jgi:hypothetical protein
MNSAPDAPNAGDDHVPPEPTERRHNTVPELPMPNRLLPKVDTYTVPSAPTAGEPSMMPPVLNDHSFVPDADSAYRLLSFDPTYTAPSPRTAAPAQMPDDVWYLHFSVPDAA